MSQYDAIATTYKDIIDQTDLWEFFDLYSWIRECGSVAGLKVLDLGCGTGVTSRYLASRGAQVIGVDQSEGMLQEAIAAENKNPLGIHYEQQDAANLPHLGDFDLVTPTYLLHYASSKEELAAFVQGVARNLKPGGRLIGMNNNPDRPVSRRIPGALSFEEWQGEAYVEGSQIKVHLLNGSIEQEVTFFTRFWQKQTYEAALQQAGFSDIAWIPMTISEEGRQYFTNWQQVEAENSCVVISARRV